MLSPNSVHRVLRRHGLNTRASVLVWWPAFARYLIPKYTGLRLDLDRYLNYYNTDRAHTGRWTKGRTPEEVIGKVKMWSR